MIRSAIVIGAGVFGASIAQRLAADGVDVTLIERDAPAGPRSSSRGHSRIIRCGHGADVFHTRLARRASALWREVEAQTGEDLLVECGVLWLAHRDDGWEAASERTLRAEGIPVQRLTPDEAAARYPSFSTDGLAFAVLEAEAGMLRAERAVHALVALAQEQGARLVTAEARPDGDGVLADGRRLEADAVVWACGPWLGRLFPGLAAVEPHRAEYATFACGPGWGAADGAPVWVDFDGEVYGLPDLDGQGFKVAPDGGPPVPYDPDVLERPLTDAGEAEARAHLRARFPALADAARTGGRVCQFEWTADAEFILAPHPEHPTVWIAGGGSGHGFKHGPALGELVRDLVTGAAASHARHALGPRDAAPDLMWGPGARR